MWFKYTFYSLTAPAAVSTGAGAALACSWFKFCIGQYRDLKKCAAYPGCRIQGILYPYRHQLPAPGPGCIDCTYSLQISNPRLLISKILHAYITKKWLKYEEEGRHIIWFNFLIYFFIIIAIICKLIIWVKIQIEQKPRKEL